MAARGIGSSPLLCRICSFLLSGGLESGTFDEVQHGPMGAGQICNRVEHKRNVVPIVGHVIWPVCLVSTICTSVSAGHACLYSLEQAQHMEDFSKQNHSFDNTFTARTLAMLDIKYNRTLLVTRSSPRGKKTDIASYSSSGNSSSSLKLALMFILVSSWISSLAAYGRVIRTLPRLDSQL